MKSWFNEHIFPQNISVRTENNSKDHVFQQNIRVQTVNNRNEVVLHLDSDEKHYLNLIEKEISRRKNKQGETR
jgi:hypothetical protein